MDKINREKRAKALPVLYSKAKKSGGETTRARNHCEWMRFKNVFFVLPPQLGGEKQRKNM